MTIYGTIFLWSFLTRGPSWFDLSFLFFYVLSCRWFLWPFRFFHNWYILLLSPSTLFIFLSHFYIRTLCIFYVPLHTFNFGRILRDTHSFNLYGSVLTWNFAISHRWFYYLYITCGSHFSSYFFWISQSMFRSFHFLVFVSFPSHLSFVCHSTAYLYVYKQSILHI